MNGKKEDLTGKQFGRLTVIRESEPAKGSRGEKLTTWICQCSCGKVKTIRASELIRGHTVSCGCQGKENRIKANKKHGLSGTRLYHIYLGMLGRCFNKSSESFKHYGGRGITVCEEWLGENGAKEFANWAIANGYNNNLSIDRIDVNEGYKPSNCRFVTNKEQQNNRTDNVLLTVGEETMTMKEWSDRVGIKYSTLRERIHRGWDAERAVKTQTDKRYSHAKKIGG